MTKQSILTNDEAHMIKKSLQLWFWIEKLESNHTLDEKYDKHLLKKVEVIQKLVDNLMPESDISDGSLVFTVENNLYGLYRPTSRKFYRRAHFAYDVIKAFVHNEILRKYDYDPLIEFPKSYKHKVDEMRGYFYE